MTDIKWGPAIAVDGKRPGWLCSGEWRRVRSLAVGEWQTADVESPGDTIPDMEEWNWGDITAIRLPADHPHYRQTEAAPIDWSGELEAVHEDGRVVPVKLHSDDGRKDLPMRLDQPLSDGFQDCIRYFNRDGSCNVGGWRIRNVAQPTPQADTKPDLTARAPCMTISEVREMVAKGEDAVIATMLERGYALPEPVDPDLIEARKLAAAWSESQDVSHSHYLDGHMDDSSEVRGMKAALARGRGLALAGEKEA